MTQKPTKEEFLKDVANHEMFIRQDGAGCRHLLFSNHDNQDKHFNLTTWPGYLAISGDMGAYIFAREEDMFDYFRSRRKEGDLNIAPDYWSGKLVSIDTHSGVKNICDDKLKDYIWSCFREKLGNTPETPDQFRIITSLWDDIKWDVMPFGFIASEEEVRAALRDFKHHETDFVFEDWQEVDLCEYSYRFTWACYAIAWGIQKYDEQKGNAEHD